MPEKPKGKPCEETAERQSSDDPPAEAPRSYYYDDAHGYETFVPDEDADDAEHDETDPERDRQDRQ